MKADCVELVFQWPAVLVSYGGQKQAKGCREGFVEGWLISASWLQWERERGRSRFHVEISLAV